MDKSTVIFNQQNQQKKNLKILHPQKGGKMSPEWRHLRARLAPFISYETKLSSINGSKRILLHEAT